MATDTLERDETSDGQVVDAGALSLQVRAEIDIQITTAKQYPRSIKEFKRTARELATLDEETAASMFYVLPRAGKKIEGPSVRMAEVVACSFGNLRYGSRVIGIEGNFIVAQGACHDLEKNNAITWEVRRRITNKDGKRYNEDMIQTAGLAAASIAFREAVFRVVPRALFADIVAEAKQVSVGKATTMSESRHKAFDWFKKTGATEPQILAYLGRAGIDDVTLDDLVELRGLVTAIKDGEATVEEVLAVKGESAAKVSRSEVNEKLKPKAKPVEPDDALNDPGSYEQKELM